MLSVDSSRAYCTQLLKALNSEGMFSFNFELARWEFDLSDIALKSISTDVVELLLAQMMKFSPATRRALQVAACLGNEELSAETLAQASGRTVLELSAELVEAVEEGMLVAVGSVGMEAAELLKAAESASVKRELEREVKMEVDGEGEGAGKDDGEAESEGEETLPKRGSSLTRRMSGLTVPEFYSFFHDRCQQGKPSPPLGRIN